MYQAIFRMYVNELRSIAEISREFKIGYERARRILTEQGVAIRSRAQDELIKTGKYMESLGITVDDLRRMYIDENKDLREIGGIVKTSHENIRRWLKNAGIERRRGSEAVALQWQDNPDRKNKASEKMRESIEQYYANGGDNPSQRPEVRKKISESKMGDNNPMRGTPPEETPRWRGGHKVYRKNALKNLPAECVNCGSKDKVHVHHKDFNRKNNKIANLVVLCPSCHGKEHSKRKKELRGIRDD